MRPSFARCIEIAGLALLILFAAMPIFAADTVDLRGYGKVTATIAPNHAEFQCESPEKADILLGKMLADLFWDAGEDHVQVTAPVNGKEVLVHLWPPYGALVAGRDGSTVLVTGGKGEQEALAAVGADTRFLASNFQFKPSKPYPMYLDFFDLRAWKSATPGLYYGNKMDNEKRMQFANEFCNGGLMGWTQFRSEVAPGVNPDFAVSDTDLGIAEANHQMYSVSISTGVWPAWAQNRWPQLLEQDAPDTPAEAFYGNAGPDEAMGITPAQRYQSSLGFLRDVIERYKNRNAFGGMELYCGDYGCETFFTNSRQGDFGYTAVGEAAFRRWLRETRKYSLSGLGERWYGDPGHFKSWSEVELPELSHFCGDLNDECLNIKDRWLWMPAGTDWNTLPEVSATDWLPVAEAPSRTEFISVNPQGRPAFWRTTFGAVDWLKKNAGKDAWLVCNVINNGSRNYQVWLNGKALIDTETAPVQYDAPITLKVTGLLANGQNQLALSLARGQIRGPIFLTTTKPEAYPYLGRQGNARYLDALLGRLDIFDALVIGTMEYARNLDPDRPFVIDATTMNVKEAQSEAVGRLGGSIHDTGYESSFQTFNTRLGYAGGFYGSCEPAGYIPTNDPGNWAETRMLSQMIFNGDGHFRMTGDASYFYDIEKRSGWLKTNLRDINLVGKALPEKPSIAILASSENAQLFDYRAIAEWSLGRGEFEACHYDYVIVNEGMLAEGKADDYPVLFDTNTQMMSPATIAAIRRYVENGGTFIALHGSGRHDILEPDTWPISVLTGFKVNSIGEKGDITFANDLPLLKGLEGKQFAGEGSAINWKKEETAKGVGLSLTGTTPDAVTLAKWADGTTAVGMRKLGKGRVILLGSTFWRGAGDSGSSGFWRVRDYEMAFLEKLLPELGVQRAATASDKMVYARKMISKNGLQNWLVTLNSTGDPITVQAGFTAAEKPPEVLDLETGRPVPFSYGNGWVTVKSVTIPAFGRKVYAAPRAGLAGGLDAWWGEKTKFWKRGELKPIAPVKPEYESHPGAIGFDQWKFLPDKDDTVSGSDEWAANHFADAAWRNADNTPWNFQFDDLKSYNGVGLYRSRPFSIPARWRDGRVTLNFQPPWAQCYSKIEFYLNGVPVQEMLNPHRKVDVTARLKSSGNVLAVKMTGWKPVGGLFNAGLWLQPEPTLKPAISLLGEWDAVDPKTLGTGKVLFPGVDRSLTDTAYLYGPDHRKLASEDYILANHLAAKVWRVQKDVEVPASWRGKNVFFRIDSPQMNSESVAPRCGVGCGMMMINNVPISFTAPPNAPVENETINVTPFIKFGQKNRIEIWPRDAANGNIVMWLLIINNMDLGCEAR